MLTIEDRERTADRISAAQRDPTGRIKLFVDHTQTNKIDGPELARLRGSLRELYCGHNPRLHALPSEVTSLWATLTILDCSHSALRELPADFSDLRNVTYLNLSHNQLSSFVWECRGFQALTHLDVSCNRLQYVSPSFCDMFVVPPMPLFEQNAVSQSHRPADLTGSVSEGDDEAGEGVDEATHDEEGNGGAISPDDMLAFGDDSDGGSDDDDGDGDGGLLLQAEDLEDVLEDAESLGATAGSSKGGKAEQRAGGEGADEQQPPRKPAGGSHHHSTTTASSATASRTVCKLTGNRAFFTYRDAPATLLAALPKTDDASRCFACHREPSRGGQTPNHVYARFVRYEAVSDLSMLHRQTLAPYIMDTSSLAAAAASAAKGGGNDEGYIPPVIPVLYACCSADCSKAMYGSFFLQSRQRLSHPRSS